MKSTQKPARPKKEGKKQDSSPQLVERETPSAEESVKQDPYDNLRYQEISFPPITDSQMRKTKVVPVLKKVEKTYRSRRQSSGKQVASVQTLQARVTNIHWKEDVLTTGKWIHCLSTDVSDPQPLSQWMSIQNSIDRINQAIYKTNDASIVYKRELWRSLQRESAALKLYKEVKHRQLEMENHCIRNTGKTREDLLLRNKQFLPHLSTSGKEIPILRQECKLILDKFPSKDIIYYEKSDSDFERPLPRGQQTESHLAYRSLSQWVGCPEITDEIRNELKLNKDKVTSVLKNAKGPSAKDEGMPCVADLGVVGLKYGNVQRSLREIMRQGKRRSSSQSMKDKSHASLDSTASEIPRSRRRRGAPGVVDSDMTSRVSLTIANVKLSWTKKQIHEERIIELGCTADIGRSAVNSISMKNTGTAVIRFDWVKRQVEENTQPRRLNQLQVIFDSSGGVIKPNEVYRLPFMYKAITGGYYSEDWYLKSKPVLENGAPVILRLWGFSRKFDPYLMVRQRLDETLHTRVVDTICRLRANKIVEYLPLQETTLKETRFPTTYGSPELFLLNNPWLNYHSADVYRLGKLLNLIEKEQVDLECTLSTENVDQGRERKGSLDESMISGSRGSRDEEENAEEKSDDGSLWDFSAYCQELDRIWQETNLDLLKLTDTVSEKSSHEMKVRSSQQSDELINRRDVVEENEEDDEAKETGQEYANAEEDKLSNHPKAPKAKMTLTNVADPNIVVHTLRQKLLGLSKNLPFQEAAFSVMSKTVDRLHFRTPAVANGNWKLTVCSSFLAHKLDLFSEYACHLKQVCCLGESEAKKVAAMLAEAEEESVLSGESEYTESAEAEPQNALQEDFPNTNGSTSLSIEGDLASNDDKSESISQDCESQLPWMAFEPDRYQGVYRMLLHIRMFQLLSDLCDRMDAFLRDQISTQVDCKKEYFIRVRQVPWNIDPQDELEKEPPPSWIKIAQRIANMKAAIRERKQEVDEIERLMKGGEKKALS